MLTYKKNHIEKLKKKNYILKKKIKKKLKQVSNSNSSINTIFKQYNN